MGALNFRRGKYKITQLLFKKKIVLWGGRTHSTGREIESMLCNGDKDLEADYCEKGRKKLKNNCIFFSSHIFFLADNILLCFDLK